MLAEFRHRLATILTAQAARLGTLAQRLATAQAWLGPLTVTIDDATKGWTDLWARPNDRAYSEVAELYRDALEATRKNPLAKTIVDITTDFVLGDGIRLTSSVPRLQRFLDRFWHHPQNRIDQRLQAMSDELARAGDLFIALFRNPQNGMSYLRFVTKEQIVSIETAPNDWETEIAYYQVTDDPTAPKQWLSPSHPDAAQAEAVMLHYSVNRPIGASFGEGDLDTIIPWLLRYSRMLEDRVRLHWALRSFLWFVTVPTSLVNAKKEQYSRPPEPGSIIVKDDAEDWEVKTPSLHAADARHDMQAVRQMIDAAGYPPHWRGEPGDANLATATAMQLRPERHLRRRQNFIVFMLQDIIYQAFIRAAQIGKGGGSVPDRPYNQLFKPTVTDISRTDNKDLANAAYNLSLALNQIYERVPGRYSPSLTSGLLRLIFKFAGEPQAEEDMSAIMRELEAAPEPEPEEEPAADEGLAIYHRNGSTT